MKPEEKKYILEHRHIQSIEEIAQELGLKKERIRKFLERQRENKESMESPEKTKPPLKNKPLWVSIALIIILGFIVYGNSLDNDFIWDDRYLVNDNVYIKNWSNISKIFTEGAGAGAGRKMIFYRPLQILTYMADYSLWKMNVKGYHLTNILLHILSALAIFWLINILYDNWLLSLLTSLFFVIHPIHTEAVTYISGRADPLAALFILLCAIFYIKNLQVKSITFYFCMLLSYALALLSRENSLILPPLLLLYHYSFKQRLKAKQFLPILTMSFIYIFLRFTLLKFLFSHISHTTSLLQRLPSFFVAIANYLRIIILPFHLHMEYGDKLFDFTHPQAILGMIIFFALLIYVLRERKTRSLAFFSISWFFIALLPSSNLYPINAYMAEHWLYLPSIGFFLILANILSSTLRTKHLKTLIIVIIACLLTFYGYLTHKQNSYWKKPIVFYNRILKYNPKSSRIYNNLANRYSAIGENEQAIAAYKKAIEVKPDYVEAYNNLGNTYGAIGENEQAIASYKKAIEIKPDYAEAYYNLGNKYNELGKKEQAVASYKKAVEIEPNYAQAYNNLGNRYREIKREANAMEAFKMAVKANPILAESYYNLAIGYFYVQQYNLAIQNSDKAQELGYANPEFIKALEPYRKIK